MSLREASVKKKRGGVHFKVHLSLFHIIILECRSLFLILGSKRLQLVCDSKGILVDIPCRSAIGTRPA